MNHGAVLLLCVCLGRCSAVIYKLNDTEYDRMPPISHMEPYDPCFTRPGGLYCTVDFALVSDTPNPLMEMIQEYSEVTTKHFNHSKLTYGVCVTTSCAAHNSTDLRLKLESCLNDTMWSEYGLKTKVPEKLYCEDDKKMVITTGDFAVAGCILMLLLLNVVGTCYDFFADPEKDRGVKFLLCFSLPRNWRRLVAPAADGPEPRLKRLKAFNGVKTLAMFLVIMAHSMIICSYFASNTHFVENVYDNLGYHVILNGTVIVQTFFIVSGFLLAYNLRLYAEKQNLNWLVILKAIVMRWLRLTPPYAVVMAFVLTWYRHLGRGPIWQKVVGSEIADCEKTWWLHLLYVNNYVDGSECLSQTWYLAADTQLYVMGVIVCVVCTSPRSRAAVLSLLFAIGVAIPAAITYYKDLDGVVISSPEAIRGFSVHDPTYIEVYSRGHTNIPSYILGLALGHITYNVQTSDYDTNKLKKYRFLTWLLLPVGILIVATGRFFYLDAPRASLVSRVTAATLIKPIFGFVIAYGLGTCIFKVENYYRGVLEWRGWTSLSRVTYTAYLSHYPLVKYFLGTQVSLLHISFLFMSEIFFGTIVLSYLLAFPIWLLIEAPLAQLLKVILQIGTKEKEEKEERKEGTTRGKPVVISYNFRQNM